MTITELSPSLGTRSNLVTEVPRRISARAEGTLLGILSIAAFSLTLPLTRLALPAFGVLGITAGRAAVAGIIAAGILLASRAPLPNAAQERELFIVALGTIVGFPLFASLSMGRVGAGHGAIVVAVVPLLTAVIGSRLARERLGRRFWLASIVGAGTVLLFSLRGVRDGFAIADLLLAGAGACAAVGYAYGGKLARELGGARVVCWALVMCLPLSLPLSLFAMTQLSAVPPPSSLLAVLYLALVSQLGAYFSWNRGLAVGGIARVSQTQLLQPFFTITAAAVLLGEPLRPDLFVFAIAVAGSVAVGSTGRARNTGLPVVLPSKET
jgi:drug/metabolite transporter (DMT)-like permease